MATHQKRQKKVKKTCFSGIASIQSTFNNTIITISDLQGNTLAWSASGVVGFKGTRKATPYAAQLAAQDVVEKVKPFGLKSVVVHVKGPGSGREAAIRALHSAGLEITEIHEHTRLAHNGVRPPSRRRV